MEVPEVEVEDITTTRQDDPASPNSPDAASASSSPPPELVSEEAEPEDAVELGRRASSADPTREPEPPGSRSPRSDEPSPEETSSASEESEPEGLLPARIYPEYAEFGAPQAEAETARLKNRIRALKIRLEACDRTLGQVLVASHRDVCAELGSGEILERVAALEVSRVEDAGKGRRKPRGGERLLGSLLGGKRSPGEARDNPAAEHDLKVPEPIDRDLAELARSLAAHERVRSLADETVRSTLAKRDELLLEMGDLEGRIRFLRRRQSPARLEHPRSAGAYRERPDGVTPSNAGGMLERGENVAHLGAELTSTLRQEATALRQELERQGRRLEDRLARVAANTEGIRIELEQLDQARATREREQEDRGQALVQASVARIVEEFRRRFAVIQSSQEALKRDLTEAWQEQQARAVEILDREASERPARLELAAAEHQADTLKLEAARARLDADRMAHEQRLAEERYLIDAEQARHTHTLREQQDAHDKAMALSIQESERHLMEQTRSRESRTNELERMTRLRSRAESAATARRIREMNERRRSNLVWAAVVTVLALVFATLLWRSGLLVAFADYLRRPDAARTNASSPAQMETAPAPAPATPSPGEGGSRRKGSSPDRS